MVHEADRLQNLQKQTDLHRRWHCRPHFKPDHHIKVTPHSMRVQNVTNYKISEDQCGYRKGKGRVDKFSVNLCICKLTSQQLQLIAHTVCSSLIFIGSCQGLNTFNKYVYFSLKSQWNILLIVGNQVIY